MNSYGVFMFLGVWATLAVAYWWMRMEGEDARGLDIVICAVLAGAFAGGKFTLLLDAPFGAWSSLAEFMAAAGSYYGGAIIGVAAGLVAWRLGGRRLPLLRITDAICAGLPLGQALARVGCVLRGCCYGIAAEPGDWSITFNVDQSHATGVPYGVPLAPVQVYDSAISVLIFGIVLIVRPVCRRAGEATWLFCLLSGIARTAMESLRGDRAASGGLVAPPMLFAIALMIVGCIGIVWSQWKRVEAQPR